MRGRFVRSYHGNRCGSCCCSNGATVIEKHFTLSRSEGGVDSAFSLEPNELASLVAETERAHQALGAISYGSTEAEKGSLSRRRSLYVGENMKSGEIFTSKNLRRVDQVMVCYQNIMSCC